MNKLLALLNVFRKGAEVTDVEKWKQRTINAGLVSAFLSSLLAASKAFGYELPISPTDLDNLAVGIVAVGGIAISLLTAATSRRAGLPGLQPAQDVQRVESCPACGTPTEPGDEAKLPPDGPKVVSPPGDPGANARIDPFRDYGG